MIYTITGEPSQIIVGLEQFLQELYPEKPQRNHMVMVAEHLIHALQVDKHSTHSLVADVEPESGTFNVKLTQI